MWHSGAFFGSKTGLWGLLNGSLGLSVTVGLSLLCPQGGSYGPSTRGEYGSRHKRLCVLEEAL
jgi:hypothetical protein